MSKKTCPHDTPRDKWGRCRQCCTAYMREYHRARRAKVNAERNRFYHANKERLNSKRKVARLQRLDECKAMERARYHKNRDRICSAQRFRKHGVTREQYDHMFNVQGGLCAICRCTPIYGIDHDHTTGKVRGLLCGRCNAALGHFKDDISRLNNAILYLMKHTPRLRLVDICY
jgi:hypothetical protein